MLVYSAMKSNANLVLIVILVKQKVMIMHVFKNDDSVYRRSGDKTS